jgi:hypothetical protein
MHKLRELGVLVSFAAVMVAGAKVATAPSAPTAELKGQQRERVLHVMGDDEGPRVVAAVRAFPGDRWSQGDAFHGGESEKARNQASTHRVALESVLDVLDADLHARRLPGRHANAPPCKPRPQYD